MHECDRAALLSRAEPSRGNVPESNPNDLNAKRLLQAGKTDDVSGDKGGEPGWGGGVGRPAMQRGKEETQRRAVDT